ncbi:MAG: Phosphoglucosamine mutase [Methanobacteriota archaeon]|nr:MAG: Phosphoglucosamine mutase [Euryarchaeota archaeon]
MQLFGTDGVRGKVENIEIEYEDAVSLYHNQRIITPSLMRVIGEAAAIELFARCEKPKPQVVIGWDNRPNNIHLRDALTQGLAIQGCEVHWAGEIATPGLHYCILELEYDSGFMVTASHNPAHDSGLKIFDDLGFKTYPEREEEISKIVESLASEDREFDDLLLEKLNIPTTIFNGGKKHMEALQNRLNLISSSWGVTLNDAIDMEVVTSTKFLVDGSKGSTHSWLANWLTSNGLSSLEQSSSCVEINKNCGAGNFSPTEKWTWEEIKGDHVLLNSIKTLEISTLKPGQIVAAALDGDADRCLLFEVMENGSGIQVIDGDRIADDIIQAGVLKRSSPNWILAASIESDLSLTSSLDRFSERVGSVETAVGDRWLSLALCNSSEPSLIQNMGIPGKIGCEDSGHIVLPIIHPKHKNQWSLVGDGVMTLVYTILARCVLKSLNGNNGFKSGWKLRKSVKDVDRKLWDGKNELSFQIQNLAEEWFTNNSNLTKLSRVEINGSTSLLLLRGEVEKFSFSLGIRNSGTESKISVSLRLSVGCKEKLSKDPLELVELLCENLSRNMR